MTLLDAAQGASRPWTDAPRGFTEPSKGPMGKPPKDADAEVSTLRDLIRDSKDGVTHLMIRQATGWSVLKVERLVRRMKYPVYQEDNGRLKWLHS